MTVSWAISRIRNSSMSPSKGPCITEPAGLPPIPRLSSLPPIELFVSLEASGIPFMYNFTFPDTTRVTAKCTHLLVGPPMNLKTMLSDLSDQDEANSIILCQQAKSAKAWRAVEWPY